MPTLDIDGVSVEFPHEPYDCQLDYMRKLLLALKHSQNAILESPTGTGKTLCLLCTTLAWLGSLVTPTQIKPNPLNEVKRESVMNTLKTGGVVDIEDLVKHGKATGCCPYYMSREMKSNAEMIFMPYNYLLNPKIRRLYNIELENAVVIFDEAHNIEQICEEAASVELSSSTLAAAIEYIRSVCEVVFNLTMESDAAGEEANTDAFPSKNTLSVLDISRAGDDKVAALNLERLLTLKGQLIELERLIDELQVTEEGLSKPSEFLFELLGRAGLSLSTREFALNTIDETLTAAAASDNSKLRKPKGMNELSEFIKTSFDSKVAPSNIHVPHIKATVDNSHCYRVFIKDEKIQNFGGGASRVWDSRPAARPTSDRKLSYWCLSPGHAMQDLIRERVRCVVLTSGTLYPFEPIQAELRVAFPILLQNPHVIKVEQIYLSVITKGLDGETLNSSYASRDKPSYRTSLALTLIELARVTPNGLLVFFPSYAMLNQCVESWQADKLYERMSRVKRIFVEPRDKLKFTQVYSDYRDVASGSSPGDANGAALFAVMRGRASEGLDLADYAGRGVAVLGLPYPPFRDPRVQLKMVYLDEQVAKSRNSVNGVPAPTGRKWYNQQAWRAVNQSIGRVIRHHRDYGAIYLCDERFAASTARSQLPQWMQSSLHVHTKLDLSLQTAEKFFHESRIKYPLHESATRRSNQTSRPSLPGMNRLPSNSFSLKRTFQDLSQIRSANDIEVFARSLDPNCTSSSGPSSLLSGYASQASTSDVVVDSTSESLFAAMDKQTEEKTPHYVSEDVKDEEQTDDLLERKLLSSKPSKRIKLQTGIYTAVSRADAEKSASYQQLVVHRLSTAENSSERIRVFESIVNDYQTDSITSSGFDCVDRIHNALEKVFLIDCRGLLQGAISLLLSSHQKHFQNLYAKTEASYSQENRPPGPSNATIVCCMCHEKPARTPLVSTCNHVACFSCWRTVIEKGNQRCPACKTMVRRRNLTRLT